MLENMVASIPISVLLLAVIGLPLAGALGVQISKGRPTLRLWIPVISTGGAFAAAFLLLPAVQRGEAYHPLSDFLALGLSLRVDLLGWGFLFLFTGIATLIAVYTGQYVRSELHQERFLSFFLLTLTGVFGVVLAGDFLTFFLFFEFMTFSSFVLVIHRQTPRSTHAGTVYLFLGVMAGLAILLAIMLLYGQTGTMEFAPAFDAFVGDETRLISILVLFVLGFGLKAGIMPLHIWMPKAYAVSPTPANAISSGLMIKTGVYGLIRVFVQTLSHGGHAHVGDLLANAGQVLIWIGLISMLIGGFTALMQRTVFETLAYSSVSQIGFIILGLGTVLYLGSGGAMGMAGLLYHILNHTLFKVLLFLVLGVLLLQYPRLDLRESHGLRRAYPWLMAVFVIGMLGVIGMPGFNAYASKTLLHHALEEAHAHHHIVSLWWAEKLFVLASAITVCYFAKLFHQVFLGDAIAEAVPGEWDNPRYQVPLVILSVAIVGIGLFPHVVVDYYLVPVLQGFSFSTYSVEYVGYLSVWTWYDLRGMMTTFALAAVLYVGFVRSRLGYYDWPGWFSVERLIFSPVTRLLAFLSLRPSVFVDEKVNLACQFSLGGRVSASILKELRSLEGQSEHMGHELQEFFAKLSEYLEGQRDHLGEDVRDACAYLSDYLENKPLDLTDETRRFLEKLAASTEHGNQRLCQLIEQYRQLEGKIRSLANEGECPYQPGRTCVNDRKPSFWERLRENPDWSLRNLNTDALIIAGIIVIILLAFLIF